MARNKTAIRIIAFCMTAILAVAFCGCDDLGEYSSTDEYYASFGDVVLISGTLGETDKYSVEDYFYNKQSREEFLEGEDGAYDGVEHSDYVYMAIPFNSTIEMDTVALFMQSHSDVTVYINVYVTDIIPSKWMPPMTGGVEQADATEGNTEGNTGGNAGGNTGGNTGGDTDDSEEQYDDPAAETRVGEITVNLKKDVWNSFVLDSFNVGGVAQNSIRINEDQYLLIQIRNNSGVRIYDSEKNTFVDPQTGLELQKAEITMTNLLIRALEVKNDNEAQGGK